jgi:hypothetical protein
MGKGDINYFELFKVDLLKRIKSIDSSILSYLKEKEIKELVEEKWENMRSCTGKVTYYNKKNSKPYTAVIPKHPENLIEESVVDLKNIIEGFLDSNILEISKELINIKKNKIIEDDFEKKKNEILLNKEKEKEEERIKINPLKYSNQEDIKFKMKTYEKHLNEYRGYYF